MKKLAIAGLAFGVMTAGPAAAADLGVPPPVKAAPSVYSWTGCYIGIQTGGGFMKDGFVFDDLDSIYHAGGAIAGGQAGCNYQVQQLVVGVEAEGWWSGLSDRNTNDSSEVDVIGGVTSTTTSIEHAQIQNRWDATAALRAGWAFDRLLLYGRAGVAFGHFKFASTFSEAITNYQGIVGLNGMDTSSSAGSQTLMGISRRRAMPHGFSSPPENGIRSRRALATEEWNRLERERTCAGGSLTE